MGDHYFKIMMNRLITESTPHDLIESRNPFKDGFAMLDDAQGIDFPTLESDVMDGSATGKLAQCRICRDEDIYSNMDVPCSCSGSLKEVSGVKQSRPEWFSHIWKWNGFRWQRSFGFRLYWFSSFKKPTLPLCCGNFLFAFGSTAHSTPIFIRGSGFCLALLKFALLRILGIALLVYVVKLAVTGSRCGWHRRILVVHDVSPISSEGEEEEEEEWQHSHVIEIHPSED